MTHANLNNRALTKRLSIEIYFFLLCAIFCIIGYSIFVSGRPSLIYWLMSILVAILGIPHGVFDYHIACARGLVTTRAQRRWFVLSYVAITLSVLALWHLWPNVIFASVMMISCIHFGEDLSLRDKVYRANSGTGLNILQVLAWRYGEKFLCGCIILGIPCIFHQAEILAAFSLFCQPQVASALIKIISISAYAGLSLLIARSCWLMRKTHNGARPQVGRLLLVRTRTILFLVVVLGILGWTTHPLVYFTIYFCCLHSMGHYEWVVRQLSLPSFKALMWEAVPLLTATLSGIACVVGFSALVFGHEWLADLELASQIIVFKSLLSLSVPHMMLGLILQTRYPITRIGSQLSLLRF